MQIPCLGIDFGTKYFKLSGITNNNTNKPSAWENVRTGQYATLNYINSENPDFMIQNEIQGTTEENKRTVYGLNIFLETQYDDPVIQKLIKKDIFPFNITKSSSGRILLNGKDAGTFIFKFFKDISAISHMRIQTSPKSIVVTVPPFYTDNQKAKMVDLAGRAFNPRPSNIAAYTQPTCALYNYFKMNNKSPTPGKYLVINIGANIDSTEINVSGSNFTITQSWRDPFFISSLIDNSIYAHVIKEFKQANLSIKDTPMPSKTLELKRKCIEAKNSLLLGNDALVIVPSFNGSKDLNIKVTADKFETIIDPFNDMISDFLDLNEETEYKAVILIGALTKSEAFTSLIEDRFDSVPVIHCNVADGAACLAASPGTIKELVSTTFKPIIYEPEMKNHLSSSIGILVKQDQFHPILYGSGTELPTSGSYVFKTSVDNQQCAKISIFQGESKMAFENILLESITFNNLPAKPKGEICITVILKVSSDGYLTIEAYTQDRLFSERVILPDPVLVEEQVVSSARREKNRQKMELFDSRSLYLTYLKNLRSLIYSYKSNGLDTSKFESLEQEFSNKPFPSTATQFKQMAQQLRSKFYAIF